MTAPALELPASFAFRVARGLVAVLEADGLVTYHDDGSPFPADFPGVAAMLQTRPEAPDRLVSVTPYPVSDSASDSQDRVGVQMWLRYAGQNPRAVMNLADALHDSLHGLSDFTLSTGVSMSQCLRASGASTGQDSSRRWTWVENYYCDVSNPTRHRD